MTAFAPLTEDNLRLAREAIAELWAERASERGRPPPDDLSGSCKFSSMLVAAVFGLRMRGNADHQFCVTGDDEVIDLNEDASDVRALERPHRHDPRFWMSPDHAASLASCEPRVARWAATLRDRIAEAERSPEP